MATKKYEDPLELTKDVVRGNVPNIKGNYLFLKKVDSKYYVKYVGRSDKDNLQNEIDQQMDTYRANGCTHFTYKSADTVREAYETECEEYHKYGGKEKLNNRYHPDEPDGHKYPCPVEGCNHPEQ